jgi:hypothetical protein
MLKKKARSLEPSIPCSIKASGIQMTIFPGSSPITNIPERLPPISNRWSKRFGPPSALTEGIFGERDARSFDNRDAKGPVDEACRPALMHDHSGRAGGASGRIAL